MDVAGHRYVVYCHLVAANELACGCLVQIALQLFQEFGDVQLLETLECGLLTVSGRVPDWVIKIFVLPVVLESILNAFASAYLEVVFWFEVVD